MTIMNPAELTECKHEDLQPELVQEAPYPAHTLQLWILHCTVHRLVLVVMSLQQGLAQKGALYWQSEHSNCQGPQSHQ